MLCPISVRRLNLLPLFGLTPKTPKPSRRRRRRKRPFPKLHALEHKANTRAFVQSFRFASAYIVEHTASLFVVVIPGEVIAQEDVFYSLLSDLQLLHSLGVQLVVVLGTRCLIDNHLAAQGLQSSFHNKSRITDAAALDACIRAASEVRIKTEGFFSRAPLIEHMRRQSAVGQGRKTRVVSGNFVRAKAKGIVDGIDFGWTGDVRSVAWQGIRDLLKNRDIVLLTDMGRVSNFLAQGERVLCGLGYSDSGAILNCNTFDVALHTAVQLVADKLIVLYCEEIHELQLPNWLPMDVAFDRFPPNITSQLKDTHSDNGPAAPARDNRLMWDFEICDKIDLPQALVTAILSCHHGVMRSHLVDAAVDGGLLLELYTPDGQGCMISGDFHEGIRTAKPRDMLAVEKLLVPLVDEGFVVRRSYETLLKEVEHFRVFEKEQRILGCVQAKILDKEASIAELSALCVHPDCRGQGKGDALLTYVEKELLAKFVRQIVILTTRTQEWFQQRGFVKTGPAHLSPLLPQSRKDAIDPERKSQLYVKTLRQES